MNIPVELLPVIQVTLPIALTVFVAVWNQKKHLDDIIARLTRIETKLENDSEHIATLS